MANKQKKPKLSEIQERVFQFAIESEVEDDSYLLQPIDFSDPDQVRYCIDGLTLAFITYCYHRHPRGENYYEVMQQLERARPKSPEQRKLRKRADAAAAKQIPFIITLNKQLEEFYRLRQTLESLLPPEAKD